MVRVAVLVVLLLGVAVGVARTGETRRGREALPQRVVLARLSSGTTSLLARVDAQTLDVVGRRVSLGLHDLPWAPAPRGRLIAFGSGRTTTIKFVDVRSLRARGIVDTRGFVSGLAWVDPRRLLVLSTRGCCPGTSRALVVDALRRRIARTYGLPPAMILAFARTRQGFAALLGPHQGIGPVSLALVHADRAPQLLELSRIDGGWRREDRDGARPIVHSRVPGLAVDPTGTSAAVVATSGVVAEIDLASLAVEYHVLRPHLSLAGRFARWLVPEARADGNSLADVSVRRARWVRDVLVISGSDERVVRRGTAESQQSHAHGLRLLDTDNWTYRTVDTVSSAFVVARETLLASVEADPVLIAYDLDGSERWRLDGAGWPRVADGRVYLGGEFEFRRHRVRVLDLRTGRTLGVAVGRGAVSVLGEAEPCWC